MLAPKTSSADVGRYNVMYLVGEHCHNLPDITKPIDNLSNVTTKDGEWGFSHRCHYKGQSNSSTGGGEEPPGWQEDLNKALGCGTDMFYTHDFPADSTDNSVVTTTWFTKIDVFKGCWQKAQTMEQAMTDTSNQGICHDMKRDSDNWKTCTQDQEDLYWAVGCDSQMFMSTGNDHWDIKPEAAKKCAGRINDIGNMTISIIGPDGTIQSSPQIKDASVPSSENPNTADGGGSASSDQLGCDGSSNPLSWVICPVINDILVPAIQATDNIITQQLVIPSNSIFCSKASSSDDPCQAYYTAWASFRNISLGLLVIVGLAVVIAQAIGMEILDAYIIRKTLPRILIAAIGITLSWALMNFAVTLSNDLGFGVRSLIIAPFHNVPSVMQFDWGGTGGGSSLLNALIGSVGVLGGLVLWQIAGGAAAILAYLATAGLAIIIAVFVLMLRQIVITMLLILSPIALIAYVLPNTNRVFKLWWESFSKALLMFPLIAGLIAAGRVFAAITLAPNYSQAPSNAFHNIIGFVAYFGPYFMIPMTFRFSGSIMGGLGNAINQRAQGGFNFLSQARANSRKDRVARMRNGGLYRGANPAAKFMNALGDYTVDADENLAYDFGSQNRLGAIGRGKYNPLGYVGRKLLGGRALELAGDIAHATTEHTQNAAKKANIHHSTAKAMLGLLGDGEGELGKGLTPKGREALRTMYPEMRDKDGKVIGRSNIPKNGDTEGLVRLGQFLANPENTYDLSDARYAGNELAEKAGTLSRFGLDMETKRATQASVAGLVVAAEGKITPDQNNRIMQQMEAGARPGSVEAMVAADLHAQREQASTQQRHSLRRGKGSMRAGEDGGFVSVYGDTPVKVGENADGSDVIVPAYRSDKAADSLLTLREDAASASKGEVWDDTRKAAVYHGGTKWREAGVRLQMARSMPDAHPQKAALVEQARVEFDKATEIRHTVAKAIGTWGRADPGGKAKANETARAMGLSEKDILEASGFGGGADAATRPTEPPPDGEG